MKLNKDIITLGNIFLFILQAMLLRGSNKRTSELNFYWGIEKKKEKFVRTIPAIIYSEFKEHLQYRKNNFNSRFLASVSVKMWTPNISRDNAKYK